MSAFLGYRFIDGAAFNFEAARAFRFGGVTKKVTALSWTVGTFVTYSGAFEDLVFLPPSYAQQRVRMDSYVLVGGNASLTVARGIEFHARIENAFDEHYEELFGFRAPGLAAYLGLHIDFFPH